MVIGRKEEQEMLLSAAQSEYSELVAVYGRRRVGKTYLIRETFGYKFTFQHTGLANARTKDQLFSLPFRFVMPVTTIAPHHNRGWRHSACCLTFEELDRREENCLP